MEPCASRVSAAKKAEPLDCFVREAARKYLTIAYPGRLDKRAARTYRSLYSKWVGVILRPGVMTHRFCLSE